MKDPEINDIEVHYYGPSATHNMPCPVCHSRKAVLYLNEGVFLPCGECKSKGWTTLRVPSFLHWLIPSSWMQKLALSKK